MSPPPAGLKPVPKVTAAVAGGTLAALIVVVASLLGVDVPIEVAAYIEAGVLAAAGSGYAKAH
ncbi:MAG: hypothetical protein ACR2LK_09680 [Solirubrobacteraceae bacterium]